MKPDDLASLSLNDTGLVYKDKTYPLPTIRHLRFARMEVTTYVVPVKLGTEGSVGLMMEFSNGESLYFQEKPGWLLTSSHHKINGIVELYEHLSKSTFEQRLQGYLSELQAVGTFTYAGYRFHTSKRSIERDGQQFTADKTEFLRHYNYIELKPRNQSLLEKAKMQLWGGKVQAIDTLTDTDVIFSLLAHFYGMRWN